MCKPVYMREYLFGRWEKARKKLKKLSQKKLAKVAKTAPNREIRIMAVENLTDQAALTEIAKKASSWKVRKAAVEKLTDQAVLTEIAKNNSDYSVRLAAALKLSDAQFQQETYADIARNAPYTDERKSAIEQITDQAVLTEIAKTNSFYSARLAAALKLSDAQFLQETYADIARNAPDISLRKSAIEQITDQAALADIVINISDTETRNAALERLTDQDKLADIVINISDTEAQNAALERLTDQDKLANILKKCSDKDIKTKVADKIPVDRLVSLLESDKRFCNMEILESISRRNKYWIKNISKELITDILDYLSLGYLERKGGTFYTTDAIIAAHNSDCHKQQIRSRAKNILIQEAGHDDLYDRYKGTGGCICAIHRDNTYTTQYLSDKL